MSEFTQNQETKENQNQGVEKIVFKPDYSVMYISNVDLASMIFKNLNKIFKGCKGAIVNNCKKSNSGGITFKVSAVFDANSNIFSRDLSPAIASLIKAENSFSLDKDAREKLNNIFIAPIEELKMEVIHRKKHMQLIEIELNPYLSLSSILQVDQGTVIDVFDIENLGDGRSIFAIRNYVRPKQQNKKQYKNNNNKKQYNNR